MSAESARVVRHGWSHGQDFCRSRSGLAFVQHRRGQSSPAFLLSGKGLLSMFSPRELRSRGDRGTSAGDVETLSGSASTVADRNSDDEPSKSMPILSGLTVASGGGSTDTRFSAALIPLRSCGCTRVLPLASCATRSASIWSLASATTARGGAKQRPVVNNARYIGPTRDGDTSSDREVIVADERPQVVLPGCKLIAIASSATAWHNCSRRWRFRPRRCRRQD